MEQLIVRKNAKGRGVYVPADRTRLFQDELLVEVPVIVWPQGKRPDRFAMKYAWHWRGGTFALALGIPSLMNHSETPNVGAVLDYSKLTIRFYALRFIQANEELTLDYGPDREKFKVLP